LLFRRGWYFFSIKRKILHLSHLLQHATAARSRLVFSFY
jgi:hypothetical protein